MHRMRKSAFLHDIEKKYTEKDLDGLREHAEIAEQALDDAASVSDFSTSFVFFVFGMLSLAGVSYMLMKDTVPVEFEGHGTLLFFSVFAAFEIAVWFARSYAAKTAWNFMSEDDYRETGVFLRAEAASYLIYVPELVIFFIASIISSGLSVMTFGCFIIIRQAVLYALYENNLPSSACDRIILLLSSMATTVMMLALPYLMMS